MAQGVCFLHQPHHPYKGIQVVDWYCPSCISKAIYSWFQDRGSLIMCQSVWMTFTGLSNTLAQGLINASFIFICALKFTVYLALCLLFQAPTYSETATVCPCIIVMSCIQPWSNPSPTDCCSITRETVPAAHQSELWTAGLYTDLSAHTLLFHHIRGSADCPPQLHQEPWGKWQDGPGT
jgi:hypothetical protein